MSVNVVPRPSVESTSTRPLGLVTGLGFALPMTGVEATFDPNKPKPMTWFAITVAYHLIGFLILAVVVAIWP